ncbi:hypothetical protein PspLS_02560 [Pyricularia sp. CBS 133598]|nr:hypothetical protein PspLS_02560 [Pyricularia sp. CBS 133598]
METGKDGYLKGESMTWLMLVAETWDWQGFLIISEAELDGEAEWWLWNTIYYRMRLRMDASLALAHYFVFALYYGHITAPR